MDSYLSPADQRRLYEQQMLGGAPRNVAGENTETTLKALNLPASSGSRGTVGTAALNAFQGFMAPKPGQTRAPVMPIGSAGSPGNAYAWNNRPTPSAQPNRAISTAGSEPIYTDDQYTSFATANKRDRQNAAQMASFTPNERVGLAMRRGDMGEAMFDNSSIKAGGYDSPEMLKANGYDPQKAIGLPGMNPATGVGGSAIGAGLQAAAARGDWDAVGRYYASQGQPFAGRMYDTGGAGGMNQLYRTAMGLDGTGPQSYRKRDRAALMYNQASQQANQADIANIGAEAQRYNTDQTFKAAMGRNAVYNRANELAAQQRDEASRRAANTKFMELLYKDPQVQAQLKALKSDDPRKIFLDRKIKLMQAEELGLTPEDMQNVQGIIPGYARGGQVQPVLNPMGNMGMPSSMADLDPVVRQYAQYVSTASQYGLQPVAFPKFIDLLGSARTQLASLPTQGGATGFADGGAIPVAGRQVLGAGGPTSDSIPAVIDGQRPAALSSGEYVFPTEAVQFYGTDKLNKMIQKARGQ